MKKLLLALISGLFLTGSALAMAAGSGGQASSASAAGGQHVAQKSSSATTAHAEDKLTQRVAQDKTKAEQKPQKQ